MSQTRDTTMQKDQGDKRLWVEMIGFNAPATPTVTPGSSDNVIFGTGLCTESSNAQKPTVPCTALLQIAGGRQGNCISQQSTFYS